MANHCKLQDVGGTHQEDDSLGSDNNVNGQEVPPFKPETRLMKSPLNKGKYATHSNGWPLVHF